MDKTRFIVGCVMGTLILLGCREDPAQPTNPANASAEPAAVEVPAPLLPATPAASNAPQGVPTASENAVLLAPFGGLAWEDTFLTVLAKVQEIPGATQVTGHLMERQLPAERLAGDGLRTWLAGLFAESESYRTSYLEKHPLLDRPVFRGGATAVNIQAQSLSIAGLKYRMKVQFSAEKGLILVAPKRAEKQSVEFFGPQPMDYVPLIINHVELFPVDLVSPGASREIADSLMEKYGSIRKPGPRFPVDYTDQERGHLVTIEFEDRAGNTLNLYPGGKLMYRNALVLGDDSLAQIFQNRAAQQQEEQRKNRTQPGRDQLKNL